MKPTVGGLVALFMGALGCTPYHVRQASFEKTQAAVSCRPSTLDQYLLEGGAWVAAGPLLLNRDFDFSMAMAIEAGPGLAAANRARDNKAAAAKLEKLATFKLEEALSASLKECGEPCADLRGKEVRLYHVLFGVEQVRLLTVLEVGPGECGVDRDDFKRVIVLSDTAKPLETGDDAWLLDDGAAIRAEAQAALPQVATAYSLATRKVTQLDAPMKSCPAQARYNLKGKQVFEEGGRTLVRHEVMPSTYVWCSAAAAVPAPPPGLGGPRPAPPAAPPSAPAPAPPAPPKAPAPIRG